MRIVIETDSNDMMAVAIAVIQIGERIKQGYPVGQDFDASWEAVED